MAHLRQVDLRRLLGVAAELAAVTNSDEVARTIYRETARLIPVDRFTYNELGAGRRGELLMRRTLQEPFALPWEMLLAYNRFASEHPCLSYMRRPGGQAVRLSDFVSLRQFRERGLYQEVFKLAGVERQLMIAFCTAAGTTITLGFNRRGRDFTGEERAVLDLLRTHVVQAHLRADAFGRLLVKPDRSPEGNAHRLQRLGLTPREAEVLAWLSEGKTNPEISIILALSRSTIKTHLERIFTKLGCETRTAVARMALEILAS